MVLGRSMFARIWWPSQTYPWTKRTQIACSVFGLNKSSLEIILRTRPSPDQVHGSRPFRPSVTPGPVPGTNPNHPPAPTTRTTPPPSRPRPRPNTNEHTPQLHVARKYCTADCLKVRSRHGEIDFRHGTHAALFHSLCSCPVPVLSVLLGWFLSMDTRGLFNKLGLKTSFIFSFSFVLRVENGFFVEREERGRGEGM